MTTEEGVVKQYADEVPLEVRSALKALEDDARIAIIVALMKNEKMAFTDIKELFSKNSSSLSYHLTMLQDAGLVDNTLEFEKGDDHHSFYSITDMTTSILESLYENIMKIPIQRIGTIKNDLTEDEPKKFEQSYVSLPSKKLKRRGDVTTKIRRSTLYSSKGLTAM